MQAGKFNFSNGQKTFDIFAFDETAATITTSDCHIQLSYIDENGQVVQLKKELNQNPLAINIGTKLISSSVQDENGGGFLEPANGQLGNNFVAKSLAHVDFVNPSTYAKMHTREFTDQNGQTVTAVLVPVTM